MQGVLIVGLYGVEGYMVLRLAYVTVNILVNLERRHGESRRVDAFKARVPRGYYSA